MLLTELKSSKNGTYVGLRLTKESMTALAELIAKVPIPIPNPVSKAEMHITLIYSKKTVDFKARGNLKQPIEIRGKAFSIFHTQDGNDCLVLELDAPDIANRHNRIMDATGATYEHAVYNPHITLSYNVGKDFDIKKLGEINDLPKLYADQEYSEFIDDEWG